MLRCSHQGGVAARQGPSLVHGEERFLPGDRGGGGRHGDLSGRHGPRSADPEAACWAAPYFTLKRDGAEISRDLLAAAANSGLTAAAQFDTEDLRARLARGKLLGVSA